MNGNGNNLKMKSLDGKHIIELIFMGEIRHGPDFYYLKVDAHELYNKLVGNICVISPDSMYAAFQEWLTTDYNEGPRTRLLLLNLEEKLLFYGETAEKGFVVPDKFDDDRLKFYLEFYPGIVKERILNISDIQNWVKW